MDVFDKIQIQDYIDTYKQEIEELEKELEFKVIDENIEYNIKYTKMKTLKNVVNDLKYLLE